MSTLNTETADLALHTNAYVEYAQEVIQTEHYAIGLLADRLDDQFIRACELILHCQQRVVTMGVGKSGHIAKKIAASLSSTGTASYFVHPNEAHHGDLGMIRPGDVVLLLSYSGNTQEIIDLTHYFKHNNIPVIAITGNPYSALAKSAQAHLNVSVPKEACPHNLAPTTSTTASLVMGDALTVALLRARGFSANDFAISHPKGQLGKRLLTTVADLMHQDDAIPQVTISQTLRDGILEMTKKRLGMTCVMDETAQHLVGIFTDGDLRRVFEKNCFNENLTMQSVMITSFRSVAPNDLVANSLKIMRDYQITALPVQENHSLVGLLHLHDILKEGITS